MALSENEYEENSSQDCNWTKAYADRQTEVITEICENIKNGHSNFFKVPLENVRVTDDLELVKFLEHIDPKSVKSLLIDCDDWGGILDEAIVNPILKFNSLNKVSFAGRIQMPVSDPELILKNCKDSLSVVEFEFYNLSVAENVIQSITEIRNLQCLKMTQIALPHAQIMELTSFLSTSTHIKEIHLVEIKCHACNWCDVTFPLNLSPNLNLQKLTLKDMNVKVIGINTRKLKVCNFSQLHADSTCQAIYESLKHARELRSFSCRSLDDSGNLVKIIPTLHKLQYLELSWTHLGEFELFFSKEIADLRVVKFVGVNMYATTLFKLLKSLPTTSHPLEIIFDPLFTQPTDVAEKVLQDIQKHPRLEIKPGFKFDRGEFHNCYITSNRTAVTSSSTLHNDTSIQ